MPFLYNDQQRIHYEFLADKENNEVLVLVHGLGMNMQVWEPLIPILRKEYDILRYDIRGHGKSDVGDGDFSFEALGSDLLFLLGQLNKSEIHFAGDNLGGKIGVFMALAYPHLVKSLVLSTVPCVLGPTAAKALQFFDQLLTEGSMDHLAGYVVPRICNSLTDETEKKLCEMIVKVSPNTYISCLKLLIHSLPIDQLSKCRVPALFLWGENDQFVPKHVVNVFSNFLPESRYLIVPNSGQLMWFDQPTLVSNWMKDFIHSIHETKQNEVQDMFLSEIRTRSLDIVNHSKRLVSAVDHLKVELMSTFRVFINGNEIAGSWNKRYAKRLFVYLLFYRTVTREQLYDIFWADMDIHRARNSLRVSLNHLKNLLSVSSHIARTPFLISDREHISLTGDIQCDLIDFLYELDLAFREMDIDRKYILCEQILEKVSAAFLPGLFDEWILLLRNRVEEQVTMTVQSTITLLQKAGEQEKAARLLKKVNRASQDKEDISEEFFITL